MNSRLWTAKEASEFLQIPVASLYRQRYVDAAPGRLGVRVGRHLRFDPRDLDRWLQEQKDDQLGTWS